MFLTKQISDDNTKSNNIKISNHYEFPGKLSVELWHRSIWTIIRKSLNAYADGFKLAIKQADNKITVDVVTGYQTSELELFKKHDRENILYMIANQTAPFSSNINPLYDDPKYFAFNDANPQMTTHILILAKNARTHVGDLSYEEWKNLYIPLISMIDKNELGEFRLDINTKRAQAIPQFHMHILSGEYVDGVPGITEGKDGYPAY